MAAQKTGWEHHKGIATAILHDRAARRKVIFRLLLASLLMMAAGLWWIDGWLAAGIWRFVIWWAACAGLTCMVMLFALYDALRVFREVRESPR